MGGDESAKGTLGRSWGNDSEFFSPPIDTDDISIKIDQNYPINLPSSSKNKPSGRSCLHQAGIEN
jgi:hypothetical protein